MIKKILSHTDLAEEVGRRHPIILATGCFDILHRGHVEMLERAKDTNEEAELWVGLNSDEAVRKLKGPDRPIHDFYSRAIVVAALECVSRVFEIDDVRVGNAIVLIRPDVWVKGGDYTLDTLDKGEVYAANLCGTKIVLLPTIGNYSTTRILSKL